MVFAFTEILIQAFVETSKEKLKTLATTITMARIHQDFNQGITILQQEGCCVSVSPAVVKRLEASRPSVAYKDQKTERWQLYKPPEHSTLPGNC